MFWPVLFRWFMVRMCTGSCELLALLGQRLSSSRLPAVLETATTKRSVCCWLSHSISGVRHFISTSCQHTQHLFQSVLHGDVTKLPFAFKVLIWQIQEFFHVIFWKFLVFCKFPVIALRFISMNVWWLNVHVSVMQWEAFSFRLRLV